MDAGKATKAWRFVELVVGLVRHIIDAIDRDDPERVDEILNSPLATELEYAAAKIEADRKFGS